MMSISEWEQETLESIGDGLVRSAPKLASMLAIFSRLTADEEMPAREPIRRAARGLATSAAAGLMSPGRALRGHLGRQAWRWLWLVVAVALLAMTLTLSYGTNSSRCSASAITACGQAPAPAHPGRRLPAGL
jgi:hypothetical protein